MGCRRQFGTVAAAWGILLSLVSLCIPGLSQAQTRSQAGDEGSIPSLVEVYWQSSKTVVAPGITNLIVLDQDIAQAETGYDTVKFFGVERGETVALGYLNGKPVSMRVRVIQRPMAVISPGTLRRQAEMAQGSVSSNVQTSSSGGITTVALVNGFSWSQLAGSNGRLDFTSQVEDDSFSGGHGFNLRTASAFYHDPHLEVRALDFSASLIGGGPQPNLASSFSDFVALRGASVSLNSGDNHYDFFAGTTVPFFYLSLGATRDVAGFTYRRKLTDNLNVFATTSYINAPLNFLGITPGRRNNYMQTSGFTWRMRKGWVVQGAGGMSNHGGMARGEFTYTGNRMTTYGSGIVSSVLFPMNQLGSLFGGTTSFKAGWTYKNKDWLIESLTYQHVITQAFAGITTAGNSDSVSPGVWIKMTPKQDLNFNYTYSHSSGGFSTESSSGNRLDTYYHYLFTPKISDSAQFTAGSLQDPLQLSSQDQFMVRDTVSFPVKGGNMYLAVEHDQTNPSLVEKLRQELGLLTPALQNLFLSDPVSFVNSANLPPEIRALLNAQNQIGTSFSAAAQFHVGDKLHFGPNFSLSHAASTNVKSWTPYFGYGLSYAASHTIQLTSGLNNVWVLTNNSGVAQHTMVFSFGVTKTFSSTPASLLTPLHHSRVIEGRVFRDSNVKGFFSVGETGFRGMQVRLENGDTALTDELGRYKFSGVSAGVHTVSLDLNQFGEPIRMTTKANMEVDLIRSHVAVVNFGVVDFARLLGTVFNDLRFEGKRQPDSKDMPEIRLILDDGKTKRTIVSEGGQYAVDDLPPGDYTLQVDVSTVPPNYIVPKDSFQVHVSPISSVVQDVPVRALRSIAGRVFLKVLADPAQPNDPGKLKIGGVPASSGETRRGGQAGGKLGQAGGDASHSGQQGASGQGSGQDYNLVPMAGIQLGAGNSNTITDRNGSFLLRDLPAGDLTITVLPVKPMPEGMKVPSGKVHMPAEPIQVQGATIVISNPDLVPYLIGKTAQEVRDAALHPAPKPDAPAVAPTAPAADSPGQSHGTEGNTPAVPSPADTQPIGRPLGNQLR